MYCCAILYYLVIIRLGLNDALTYRNRPYQDSETKEKAESQKRKQRNNLVICTIDTLNNERHTYSEFYIHDICNRYVIVASWNLIFFYIINVTLTYCDETWITIKHTLFELWIDMPWSCFYLISWYMYMYMYHMKHI